MNMGMRQPNPSTLVRTLRPAVGIRPLLAFRSRVDRTQTPDGDGLSAADSRRHICKRLGQACDVVHALIFWILRRAAGIHRYRTTHGYIRTPKTHAAVHFLTSPVLSDIPTP